MVPSGALPKSIRKFLDSCDSELKIERCQDCGFLMELKVATFSCLNTTWEIPMPVCRKCEIEPSQALVA
jgi:hypothetical protein